MSCPLACVHTQVKAVSLQLSAMMIDANAAGAGTVSSSGGTADGAGAGASAELRYVEQDSSGGQQSCRHLLPHAVAFKRSPAS